jgi:hypothetical protein
LALGKKIIIVKNATAYTWDWYCHLVVDRASLEDLSDASFLGKLLVLPEKVRLDWKVFARLPGINTLAYLASLSATKEKSFITLSPGLNVSKLFLFVTDKDPK